MKTISKARRGHLWYSTIFAAALVCMLGASATTAHAVPPNQVLRMSNPQTFTNACCLSWGETVQVTEPNQPMPVLVNWSTDYTGGHGFQVGLMLNGGPCQFFGPHWFLETFFTPMESRTFEWVVLPGDGGSGNNLHPGTNTFTLCGGWAIDSGFSITLQSNTLSVRISK